MPIGIYFVQIPHTMQGDPATAREPGFTPSVLEDSDPAPASAYLWLKGIPMSGKNETEVCIFGCAHAKLAPLSSLHAVVFVWEPVE